VHPQRDRDTGDNDLAILRLEKPVEWTNWVQPICMQGSSEPETLTNRNLHYSGFNHGDYARGKGLAMTVSTPKCKQLTSSTVFFPVNQMCAYPVKRTKYYPGAPLMDIGSFRVRAICMGLPSPPVPPPSKGETKLA